MQSIATFWALAAGEASLLAGVGIVAARHAMRRQELRHCAQLIEHTSMLVLPVSAAPQLSLTDETQPAIDDNDELVPSCAKEWLGLARAVAVQLAQDKGSVTADDVLALVPLHPGINPVVVAQIWQPRSQWIKTGSVKSKERHGRSISVWQRKGMETAP